MQQSRLENEELEARLHDKQKSTKEITDSSKQIQKEYEKQSETLSELRQLLVLEN